VVRVAGEAEPREAREPRLERAHAGVVADRVLRHRVGPPVDAGKERLGAIVEEAPELAACEREQPAVVEREQLGASHAADEDADEIAAVGRASRPLPAGERAGEDVAAVGGRHDEPEAGEVARHVGGADPERDDRRRRVRNRGERARNAGVERTEERGRDRRGTCEHHGVGVDGPTGRAHTPSGRRPLEPSDGRAQMDRAFGDLRGERLHERTHAVAVRHEEPVAGARDALRFAGTTTQPEDQASVAGLHLGEARHGRAQRQRFGVAGVDAARERVGDALERLGAEAASHERGQTFVGVVLPARQHEVEPHAELAREREERRADERPERRRREQQEAVRQRVEMVAARDVGAAVGLARRHEVGAEPHPLAERQRPRLVGDEGVCARLDQEAVVRDRSDRAAEARAGLEQLDGAASLDHAERRRDAGDAAPDDRDPRHPAAPRTTSASMAMNAG
jgi:hypothetical protein